jgi:hypothetical protein
MAVGFAALSIGSSAASAAADPAPAAVPPPAPAVVPATAAAALERANAAYEYGDMNQVVEFARAVVDGAVPAAPADRLQALRLLGIGLYLTGRPAGAETYFLEVLRIAPRARLDPSSTRPDVVVFFDDVRRRHASELQDVVRSRSRRSVAWNFIPPAGQFKNGDRARGFLFLGLETASLATAITTRLLLGNWRAPGDTFPGHQGVAPTVRTLNIISVGVLAASWAAGVADAFLRSDREPDEPEAALSFFLLPTGAGLAARF